MSLYRNYEMKNNVSSELYAPISSLATTLQVKDGQGERWGNSFPMIATLETTDENGKVTAREIVKITGRSGDVLTIVRKYFPCLPSDESNSEGTISFSFNAGDTISNYIAKEYIDVLNNAINDIYDNGDERIKAIPTGGLGIEITDGNVRVGSEEFYFEGGTATLNDNATNYVMLDGAGSIDISTEGRDFKKVKVAKIVVENGIITDMHQRRIDQVGGEMGGDGGIKTVSKASYENGLLKKIVMDGEEYVLNYVAGKVYKIRKGENVFVITYKNGQLRGIQENRILPD